MKAKQVSERKRFSDLKEFNKIDAIIQLLDTSEKISVEELDRMLGGNESVQYIVLRIGQSVDEIDVIKKDGKHFLRLNTDIDYETHTPLSALIDRKEKHHKFKCKTCNFSGDHAYAKQHRKEDGHYYWKLVQR